MATKITKRMETETGHRLVNYDGKCAHIHGHRYEWEVTVTSHKLNETGFVADYGDLKKIMKKVIEPLDHAFVVCDKDPLVGMARKTNMPVSVLLCSTSGHPGRVHVVPFNPTTENLIDWVADQLLPFLPNHLMLHRVKVWETSSSFAEKVFEEVL